jgi:beta-lactamase class A
MSSKIFPILFWVLLFAALPTQPSFAAPQYDILYVWDENLDNVLDYQSQVAELLGEKNARRLRIVQHEDGRYGVIYDLNGTLHSSAKLMVQHGEILRSAQFAECLAIEDKGYEELFNVSYGLGPNLDAQKKVYDKLYQVLGTEVGSSLFIEQTGAGNYTLIYRRRGDRVSTHQVAKNHAKILKKHKIAVTIIAENNNPVVFGEASLLDSTEPAEEITVVVKEPQSSLPTEKVVLEALPKVPLQPPTGDTEISRVVEEYIGKLRKQGKLSSDERTGWMVYDLVKGKNLLEINSDQSFQAASMIKPFAALAFFHQAAKGELPYGPKSRQNMELMIQRSNNPATNWIMKAAGGPEKVNQILNSEYPHIFKNTSIVEYIPAGGRTYLNSAAPADYMRFLQALWNDRLPYSKEIRRLMSLPKRDRLYHGTPIPKGTLVYNKTGSTAHLCGDMGIVVLRGKNGQRYPYAIVGVIERSSRAPDYGNWMLTRGNVIRGVSTLVYENLKRQYPLR